MSIERYLHYGEPGMPHAELLAGALAAKKQVERQNGIRLDGGTLTTKHGRPCYQFEKIGIGLLIPEDKNERYRTIRPQAQASDAERG